MKTKTMKKMSKLIQVGLVVLLLSGCSKGDFERLMYGGRLEASKFPTVSKEDDTTDDVESAATKKQETSNTTDTVSSSTKPIEGTSSTGTDATTSATQKQSAIEATVSYDAVVHGVFGGISDGMLLIDIPTQSTVDTVTSATKTTSTTTTVMKRVEYPLAQTPILVDEEGNPLVLSDFQPGDRITVYVSLGQVVAIALNDDTPDEQLPEVKENEDQDEDEDHEEVENDDRDEDEDEDNDEDEKEDHEVEEENDD